VLATYGDDFYAGTPVVTRNRVGQGSAYYVATDPEDSFLESFARRLIIEQGIEPPLTAPPGIELAVREHNGRALLFVLNHTPTEATVQLPADRPYRDLVRDMTVTGPLRLAPHDVCILAP
jgi:beta-galactosidase